MAKELKRLPDGTWKLEYADGSGEMAEKVFEAGSAEEADRLAEAYLERIAEGGGPVRRVARGTEDRKKSGLLD